MARVCEICGKGKQNGHSVSHSNIKTKEFFNANLQIKNRNKQCNKKSISLHKCIKGNKISKAK